MISTKDTKVRLLLLPALLLAFAYAPASELGDRLKADVLYCSLHGGGGWVDSNLYADGKVRVSYVLQPSDTKGTHDLYVAFWNADQSGGELLVFNLSKTADSKDLLILNNQGHLWNNKGQLDIRDTLWGMYTYHKIKAILPQLKQQPARVVAVDQISAAGSSECKTPVDFSNHR